MPLKKYTKSIPLAAGMREDANSELLESPHMDYIENGRFDKHGQITKVGGYTQVGNNIGEAGLQLHSVDGTLYATTAGGVFSYNGVDFDEVYSNDLGLSLDSKTDITEELNGVGYDILETSQYFAILVSGDWEKQTISLNSTVHLLPKDGSKVTHTFVVGRAAQMTLGTTATGIFENIITVDADGIVRRINLVALVMDVMYTLPVAIASGSALNGEDGRMFMNQPNEFGPSKHMFATKGYRRPLMILGSNSNRVVLAHTLDAFRQEVGFLELTSSAPLGFNYQIGPSNGLFQATTFTDDHYYCNRPMALEFDGDDVYACIGNFYVGYADQNVLYETPNTSVRLLKLDASSFSWSVSYNTQIFVDNTTSANIPINGYDWPVNRHSVPKTAAISIDSANTVHCFLSTLTTIDISPNTGPGTTYGTGNFVTITYYISVSAGGASTPRNTLYGYNVITKPHCPSSGKAVVVLQPDVHDARTLGFYTFDSYRVSQLHTSILAEISLTNPTYRKITDLQVGLSQHTPLSGSLAAYKLPNLIVSGSSYFLLERTLNQLETLNIGYNTINVDPNEMRPSAADGNETLVRYLYEESTIAPPKSTISLLKLTPSLDFAGSTFGNGLRINNYGGKWISNDEVSDVSFVNPPYILSISYEGFFGDRPDSLFYGTPGIANVDALLYSLVCYYSYVDSGGNERRSSVSSPVYYRGGDGQNGGNPIDMNIKNLQIYTTLPFFDTDFNPEGVTLHIAARIDNVGVYTDEVANTTNNYTIVYSKQLKDVDYAQGYHLTQSFDLPLQETGEILYTETGELPASPWPTFRNSIQTKNRIFALSPQYPNAVLYSKLIQPKVFPEFTDAFSIEFSNNENPIALAALDDKVIIFTNRGLKVLYGDGPDNNGGGADFAIQDIASEVGSINSTSLITTARGLYFEADRGIYRLDRALNVTYVSGPVEDTLVGFDIKKATLWPQKAEIRFLLRSNDELALVNAERAQADTTAAIAIKGDWGGYPDSSFPHILIYNYEKDAWSTANDFAISQGLDSTLHDGRYHVLRAFTSNSCQVHLDEEYTYGGYLRLVTPWIRMVNIEDFGRVYRIGLKGRHFTPAADAGLRVDIYYDYETTVGQTVLFDPTDMHLDAAGRLSNSLRLQIRPSKQKCSAIKLDIREYGEGSGRGIEIDSVDLEFGVKPGINKLLNKSRKK